MTFAKIIRKLQIFYHEAATCGDTAQERELLQDAAMLADAYHVPVEITDMLRTMAYEGQPKDHPAAIREQFRNLRWIQERTKVNFETGRVKVRRFAASNPTVK